MYLLGKRVEELTEVDILRLVDNQVKENKSLDYKRELKIAEGKDRKEFLCDITSMYNTDGGCFVYGIDESKDEKGQNTGIPLSILGIEIENEDKVTQQIEDIVKSNTDPSISNIGVAFIKVNGKKVLVVGISKGLSLPCMTTYNESNKFYRRRNSGKYLVDVYELNQMFMQNQLLKEAAEKFRKNRISEVLAQHVFPNLDISASYFLHIIPFSFQNEASLDLTSAQNMDFGMSMFPLHSTGANKLYNLDGFAYFATTYGDNTVHAYDQLFRNGIYEVYASSLFYPETINTLKVTCLDGDAFLSETIKKVSDGLAVLKRFKVEGPFIICLSLYGIKNGTISSSRLYKIKRFTVDSINLPPVVLPTFDSDVYSLLKPNFDIVWQAVGHSQSPSLK